MASCSIGYLSITEYVIYRALHDYMFSCRERSKGELLEMLSTTAPNELITLSVSRSFFDLSTSQTFSVIYDLPV